MKTRVHTYRFDMTRESERVEYDVLCDSLRAMGLCKFDALGDPRKADMIRKSMVLDLDATHLFDNQWNTGPFEDCESGARVFDWYEPVYYVNGRKITRTKAGYWLEQTQQMRDARNIRHACGYCGKQTDNPSDAFHTGCLDSPYLKSTELHLLRWRRTSDNYVSNPRAELTAEESAYLVPLYRDAQLRGNTARGNAQLIKMRTDIESKANKAIRNATAERIGMLWVLDNFGPTMVDNCIYYNHTGRFCFGWRTPLDETITSEVIDKISEFPDAYTLKTEKRGILENGPSED